MTKKRRLLAVSGTLQDGFALRKNLDGMKEEDKAVFIGFALVRGVKMYFDVKPEGCRENVRKDFENEDEEGRRRQRRPNMNPALVVTNDWNDANVYHVFAVTEEALCEALANEPRYLGIAPDVAKVDLWAKETSESVRSPRVSEAFPAAAEEELEVKMMMMMIRDTQQCSRLLRTGFRARARWKPKGTRRGRVSRDHLRRMLPRAFGDEKPPFTTRDANIRKAQKETSHHNLLHHHPKTTTKK